MKPKILVSITTTNSDWKDRIKEIDKLGLKEIALFPTCLTVKQRKILYKLLEKTGLKNIPVVHIRHDFEAWEFAYLIKKFKTRAFNTHADKVGDELLLASKRYLKKIYLENIIEAPDIIPGLLDEFAGICLDISHWESFGEYPSYKKMPKLLKKYKTGWCHISGVMVKPWFNQEVNGWDYATHYMHNLSEMDYVKKYKKYLPKVCALEIENSLEEQLKAKEYIEKLLGV